MGAALGFPLVAAYCVSVPRLLHCPLSQSATGKQGPLWHRGSPDTTKRNNSGQVGTVTKQGVSPPECRVAVTQYAAALPPVPGRRLASGQDRLDLFVNGPFSRNLWWNLNMLILVHSLAVCRVQVTYIDGSLSGSTVPRLKSKCPF